MRSFSYCFFVFRKILAISFWKISAKNSVRSSEGSTVFHEGTTVYNLSKVNKQCYVMAKHKGIVSTQVLYAYIKFTQHFIKILFSSAVVSKLQYSDRTRLIVLIELVMFWQLPREVGWVCVWIRHLSAN